MITPHRSAQSISLKFALADDDLFGVCDDSLELRLPNPLKDACRRAAAKRGMKLAPWVRMELAKAALGQKHVLGVLVDRVGIAPVQAPIEAPAVARTTALTNDKG